MNAAEVARSLAEVAELRRGLHATEQALLDERAAHRNAEVMAHAARAYVAVRTAFVGGGAAVRTWAALLAAHDATTPSPQQRHQVIATTRLRWLNDVTNAAEVAALAAHPEHQQAALHTLRQQLATQPEDT